MKVFSTKVHGALDYLSVATLAGLPRLLGGNERTTRYLDHKAAQVLAYSLLTRYEWGAARVLPMPGHLALDAALGVSLWAAPEVVHEENDGLRMAILGLGLFSIFASLTTETAPG